jgi:hypothetical protein
MCILQLMQKFHLFFFFFHVSFVQCYSNIHISVDTACTISYCLFKTAKSSTYTVFTWIQDTSHLRWPLSNKMPAKKKYCTVNFIYWIHKTCQIPSTFNKQCHCLYFHSQCLHLRHNHHYHRLHSHSVTYHHQSHSLHWIYSTSQKPCTVTSSEVCCLAVVIHID